MDCWSFRMPIFFCRWVVGLKKTTKQTKKQNNKSFGANHDGPTNGCEPLSGDRQHVMSPQLSSEAGPIVWSNCSRRDITRFLDRNWGTCLEDRPSDHDFRYPELPPGAMYNVDHQCRLQYGPEAVHCAGMDEVRFFFIFSFIFFCFSWN